MFKPHPQLNPCLCPVKSGGSGLSWFHCDLMLTLSDDLIKEEHVMRADKAGFK